mmetsp:Transcript_33440/g.85741  ORF Transcript_33440/g.85741 Transcript_33440/m.85741 type:complete len:227 (+) Transcript_33440:312-992(+)
MDGEERPIRPAGEAVLRAFAGEDVGRAMRPYDPMASDGEEDEDEIAYRRQDFENAMLGRDPPEPGVLGGASHEFGRDEGLNEMGAAELQERAVARANDEEGLDGEAVALVQCSPYGARGPYPMCAAAASGPRPSPTARAGPVWILTHALPAQPGRAARSALCASRRWRRGRDARRSHAATSSTTSASSGGSPAKPAAPTVGSPSPSSRCRASERRCGRPASGVSRK